MTYCLLKQLRTCKNIKHSDRTTNTEHRWAMGEPMLLVSVSVSMFPICFCFFLFLFPDLLCFCLFMFLFSQSVSPSSLCFCFKLKLQSTDEPVLLVSVSVSMFPICFCFFLFLFSQSVSASCICLCCSNQWFRMGRQFDRKNCHRDYILLWFCFPNLFLILFLLLFLFVMCEIDSKMLLYVLPFSMYDLTSFSPGASTGPHWIWMHREFQANSASSIQPYARHLCS